jgi:hypothetical protein
MSLLWIINAKHIVDYKIEIQFNTKEIAIVNLENYLDKKIFKPLLDKAFFCNFKLNSWTIEWLNGADFSPEFLYNLPRL